MVYVRDQVDFQFARYLTTQRKYNMWFLRSQELKMAETLYLPSNQPTNQPISGIISALSQPTRLTKRVTLYEQALLKI